MIQQDGQVTLLDYWRVVWRASWWILALAALAALVASGVGRSQPKIYTARATILPPQESGSQSLSMSLGSFGAMFLGGTGGYREGAGASLPGVSMTAPSLSTNQDVFLALLKSRTLREEVVAEFAKDWGPSVGSMVVSIQPDTTEKGVIGLTARATHAKLAADLANYYFEHLDRMLQRYADQGTRRQEDLYKSQLERAAKEVETAEGALLKFQAENRAIAVDASTKGTVESVGYLRGSIMALEMQREIMRMRFTDQHPQMAELEKQIAELKRQYSKNLFGEAMDLPPESATTRRARKEFFVSAEKMTPINFAFLKLYRNLKIQEAFYTAALQGLQQIKYGFGVNSPRVEVLDPAIPPSAPAGSNVGRKAAVAAGSALIVGVLFAFGLEYVRRLLAQERQIRPPVPTPNRQPDDGSGFLRTPHPERVRTMEAGGIPSGRAEGSLSGRE